MEKSSIIKDGPYKEFPESGYKFIAHSLRKNCCDLEGPHLPTPYVGMGLYVPSVEQRYSTRNSIVTNLYPVRPPRQFNKKVWLSEKARSDPQEVIGTARSMNSITVQWVGVKSDQTLQAYIPLQSLKQFEVKFSPDPTLELLLNLEQQSLIVSTWLCQDCN